MQLVARCPVVRDLQNSKKSLILCENLTVGGLMH